MLPSHTHTHAARPRRRRIAARPAPARALALLVLLAAAALAIAACAGGDGGDAATPGATATVEPAARTSPTPAPTATPEPRRIVFMAGFRPQANLPFVAAYVADAQGFFAEEGLEVEIQHSSGQGEHLKLLLEGRIQFTTATAPQVLRRRAEDLPVRAVALFGQRGDQGYIARADSGIDGPEDFAGRTVGFKSGVIPAELHAMLATAGLTVDDVGLQSVGFDPRIFIEGGVDVYPVFLNNEPFQVRQAGVDINVIDPHDFGVPTLGLTYLTHADLAAQDPDLVRRFVRATLRATEWIREHVDESVEITLQWAPGADAEHQRFLLETDLHHAERADGMGRADLEQWQALHDVLRRYDVLEQDVELTSAWDGSFIEELYAAGDLAAGSAQRR